MRLFIQRAALSCLLAAAAGCSSIGGGKAPAEDDSQVVPANSAVTIRFNEYVDQRQIENPRFLGQVATRVIGVSGKELVLDEDVAVIAAAAMKKHFRAEFRVLEPAETENALFAVSGVIKELTLHVRNRDEISIAIETTLKDASTGAVVWSGLVTEKSDRFAGVMGNSKADLVAYLDKGLNVVGTKTVEAISASLAAARPKLFNLTPGTEMIKGVDVHVAPAAATAAVAASTLPAPASQAATADSATGILSVNTTPARAKIYLNGVYFGLSPLRSEVEAGIHDVVVKLKGYKTATEKVSVRKGDSTELELSLDR